MTFLMYLFSVCQLVILDFWSLMGSAEQLPVPQLKMDERFPQSSSDRVAPGPIHPAVFFHPLHLRFYFKRALGSLLAASPACDFLKMGWGWMWTGGGGGLCVWCLLPWTSPTVSPQMKTHLSSEKRDEPELSGSYWLGLELGFRLGLG